MQAHEDPVTRIVRRLRGHRGPAREGASSTPYRAATHVAPSRWLRFRDPVVRLLRALAIACGCIAAGTGLVLALIDLGAASYETARCHAVRADPVACTVRIHTLRRDAVGTFVLGVAVAAGCIALARYRRRPRAATGSAR